MLKNITFEVRIYYEVAKLKLLFQHEPVVFMVITFGKRGRKAAKGYISAVITWTHLCITSAASVLVLSKQII